MDGLGERGLDGPVGEVDLEAASLVAGLLRGGGQLPHLEAQGEARPLSNPPRGALPIRRLLREEGTGEVVKGGSLLHAKGRPLDDETSLGKPGTDLSLHGRGAWSRFP